MTALKRSLDRALSGVEFRPENRRRVREAVGKGDVKMRGKMSAALIFALIAALILAGVAVAAVITRGFGWYATQIDDPAAQYSLNELDKRATVAEAERTPAGQESGPRFEVTQAYYDGSRIDVAYTLTAPDHYSDASWRPTAEELKQMRYEETDGILQFEDSGVNGRLQDDFTRDGACGLHIHSYFVGENFSIDGVKSMEWSVYGAAWEDGETSGCATLKDLPKKAMNKDSVSLTFSLTEYDTYYYRIATGFYYRIVRHGVQMLDPIVVPRGKGETVTIKASAAFDAYRVIAKAFVSPVEIEVLICQVLPDAWVVKDPWTRGRDLKGVDYIKDYHLVANGALLESSPSTEGNGAGRLENELPKAFRKTNPKNLYTIEIEGQGVPEGAKELRLRPVYSIGGERPAEDVVLALTEAG